MKISTRSIKKIKDILKDLRVRKPKPSPVRFLTSRLNDKVRLVGKVGGYYVTVEKYVSEYEGKFVVKNACAVAIVIIGVGLFYFLTS
jgi:hypothetical protein